VGEIRIFAGNFAPRNFAFCDGQLIAVSQNDALFSLLGTTYGGDGRTTFGLPDLRGRVPVHMGQGPGLSNRPMGQRSGTERVTLAVTQLPSHTHALMASADVGSTPNPGGNVTARSTSVDLYSDAAPTTAMASQAITSVGGGQEHDNMMPYLGIRFIIALAGVYPSRN
jgi:microcystin-dependent protein